VDTYKAKTAEAAIRAGAHMLNDVWGLKADPEMGSVEARYRVPICIMHNKDSAEYGNLTEDMIRELAESIEIALKAGISVEVSADLEVAACNDDLSSTINYSRLCADIERALLSRKYDLIEAAAIAVIKEIFNKYPVAVSVKVLLKKPWAPMGRHLKYVAVEIERRRLFILFIK
jgi:dihydroneopterin aldolase